MAENETKTVEETTSTQENVSPEDKKTEVIEIPTKELEDLKKKAADFDGIIEKKRLQALAKREEKSMPVDKAETSEIDEDAIIERAKNEAREVATKIFQDNNRQSYDENLTKAYQQVKANLKWIDDDEIIANIAKEFRPGNSLSVEDLAKRLEVTAANLYPDKYKSSLEESIKAKVLAQDANIQIAGGAGGSVPHFKKDDVVITKDDQRIADKYFGGDVQRYLKSKKT